MEKSKVFDANDAKKERKAKAAEQPVKSEQEQELDDAYYKLRFAMDAKNNLPELGSVGGELPASFKNMLKVLRFFSFVPTRSDDFPCSFGQLASLSE